MNSVSPIREALIAQPFRPFAMHLVDGTKHVVTHPDWVTIPPARRPREIIFWSIANGDEEDYRGHWIDVELVMKVVIPPEPPVPSNSPQAQE